MCLSTHSLGVLPVSGDASRTFTGVYVTGASMKSTVQFLDAVRVRHGLTSDYQLAKFLRARQQTISRYRNGQSMMDEAMCLKIAAALSLDDPGEVLVAIAHERNPVIGEHPSSGRVDAYMLAAGALHLGIANLRSGDWRSAWQWGGIVIEAGAIGSNYLIGIGVPF